LAIVIEYAQAADGLCGEFQQASQEAWAFVSKPIQVYRVSGGCVFERIGSVYSLESIKSWNGQRHKGTESLAVVWPLGADGQS